MKTIIAVVFAFFLFVFVAQAQESFTAYGSTVNFTRPDPANWNLVRNEMDEKSKKYLVMFEHNPIKDSKGRNIKPVIAVICEKVPDSVDVIRYSIAKRGHTAFKVNKMMSYQDGSFTYRNAIGYEGEYKRRVVHKILVGHLCHASTGVQVICDSTDGVYDKVEADMRNFIRSVTLK